MVRFCGEKGIGCVLAHAPYTLNACARDEGLREFARNTMTDDLERLSHIPGCMYNFHPGSHVQQGAEKGIELIADTLNRVLSPQQNVTVLLETMAGKGSEVGRNFEELRAVIDRVELSGQLGVCLDTCHVFDGGYDIVNDLEGVLMQFDRIIGLNRLKAVHLNDSMNGLGSHKDRHQKIGQGEIGLDTFKAVINHKTVSYTHLDVYKRQDYPLQKKRHSFEYLRTISHLRPRTNTFQAVFRVRSLIAYAIHTFFMERGFVYVHTPLITGSDCEGAGEMFQVTTMDLKNIPMTQDGQVDRCV